MEQTERDLISWIKLSKMLIAAMKAGDEKQVRITAVVLNKFGNHIGSMSHPCSSPISFTMATAKAFTALNFGVSSHEIANRIRPETQAKLSTADSRLLFLGGGMPINASNGIVGAIGVSGATPDQDFAIAEAALIVFT